MEIIIESSKINVEIAIDKTEIDLSLESNDVKIEFEVLSNDSILSIVNNILSSKTTDDIKEGLTNLYYKDSRVAAWISAWIQTQINYTDARALNSSTDGSPDKSFATVDYVKAKTANTGGSLLFLPTDIC